MAGALNSYVSFPLVFSATSPLLKLQAFFLVSDDIMDSSITRRSQPCWYRLPEIGMIAINDSFMLEAAIYQLLKTHFRSEKFYVDLLELFHETTYQTEMGQLVDLITAPEDHVDLNKFSLNRCASLPLNYPLTPNPYYNFRHRTIVIYKTAYYSFYLPVACALYMLNIPESYTASGVTQKPFEISKSILLPLGEYFQIQDDFLDYSAPPEQLGKIGTDIIDNKCSWVINTALLLCSKPSTPGGAEMRKVLDENYGRKDAQCEARVKKVYETLNITKVYGEYEERVVGELKAKIDGIVETEGGLKREVFESFLGKIYKRSK